MSRNPILLGSFIDEGHIDVQTGPFGTQLKASDYCDTGTPVINVRNVGLGDLRPEKLEFVPDDVVQRLEQHVLQENDIVFGRKGAVDRHLLVKEGQKGWLQGSDCIRLRILSGGISPHFLSYALRMDAHKRWMLTQCSNKATMASLNHDVIRRIPILLPTAEEQAQIVRHLSAFDELIETNRRRLQLLEQSARMIYKEWFVERRFPGHEHTSVVHGVPEAWDRVPTPAAIYINPPTRLSDGVEHWSVEMADLHSDSMVIQQATRRDGRSGSKFRNGDTLFARITPCLENGKTGFVDFMEDGEVARGSTEFIVLRSKRLTPEFVYCLARTYEFRENAIKSMVGSSGRQRVQESCFEKFLVLVPPSTLLGVFTECVEPMFQQIRVLHSINHKLKTARDLLLPRLMSGGIAV